MTSLHGTGTVNVDVSVAFYLDFDATIDRLYGGDTRQALQDLYQTARKRWAELDAKASD